jgi:hypothetical protein
VSTQLSYQSSNTLNFRSFEVISKLIGENGGQIVDLDEPKLTHVIIDKRDDTRRLALMSQTAKYVRVSHMKRLIVISASPGQSAGASLSQNSFKHALMKEHCLTKKVILVHGMNVPQTLRCLDLEFTP